MLVDFLVLLFLILFFESCWPSASMKRWPGRRLLFPPVPGAAGRHRLHVSVKLAGAVLVSALLVIPGATGYRLSSNYRGMLILSLATGLAGSLGGLLLSYYTHIPAGAAMVLVMTLLFLLALAKKPGRPKIKTTKEEVP